MEPGSCRRRAHNITPEKTSTAQNQALHIIHNQKQTQVANETGQLKLRINHGTTQMNVSQGQEADTGSSRVKCVWNNQLYTKARCVCQSYLRNERIFPL